MGNEPYCSDCKYYGICDDPSKDVRMYPCDDFQRRGSMWDSPRFADKIAGVVRDGKQSR